MLDSLSTAAFPAARPRRLRARAWLREMAAETRLHPSDLILPLFVQEGKGVRDAIPTLPGVARLSMDEAVKTAKEAASLSIPAIALFPVTDPGLKTPQGSEALNPKNLLCRAIAEIKSQAPDIGVIADVALDPYTSHGHDGILNNGEVDNDATVEILCQQALTLARAGADVVAPSDMMDGRVGAIRRALEDHSFKHTVILSYTAKYASAFYGPFRDAVGSAQSLGKAGKHSYQMHPANAAEALREAALDVAEGADMLMVKPALPYLDIISMLSAALPLPLLAYHTSGEYAMLHAAAAAGMLDAKAALSECLLAIKRAGAQAILTYGALEAAKSL